MNTYNHAHAHTFINQDDVSPASTSHRRLNGPDWPSELTTDWQIGWTTQLVDRHHRPAFFWLAIISAEIEASLSQSVAALYTPSRARCGEWVGDALRTPEWRWINNQPGNSNWGYRRNLRTIRLGESVCNDKHLFVEGCMLVKDASLQSWHFLQLCIQGV